MKIKSGDMVVVITGKNKDKTGKVVRILEKENRVVVEGVNMATRHVRKTKDRKGEKVQFEAPVHASNVMLIDPKSKKRSRVGYLFTKEGKKQRVSKNSKTTL